MLSPAQLGRMVYVIAGHELLSFIVAYSRYNQIKMHPKDEDKTAFNTSHAIYRMPFGLKNIGATFQRMVNEVFKELIGNTMECMSTTCL